MGDEAWDEGQLMDPLFGPVAASKKKYIFIIVSLASPRRFADVTIIILKCLDF